MTKSAKLADLERIIGRINDMTVSPREPVNDGVWNVDNYHLCRSGGGFALVRVVNADGAVRTVIACDTKRELFSRLQAYVDGLLDGKQIASCARR
ncbi:hypothetical protein [Salinisphaera sp.]|uniref:hypothetical protein n=1 Tax=Salinisphaera sp. TaxID=1914330 RepID=UPI000C638882|nr:hypothetical protein [Salinisphaera sp.]MAS09900.1 hypothetical protein [Salinisphaera sp.]MAS09955.1 hypothetical protein [Salinisphaera sp.]|tara:strand:- start:18320 stop:18604 length:285 start_codon:yes stop_codon:yes gene_type:complete